MTFSRPTLKRRGNKIWLCPPKVLLINRKLRFNMNDIYIFLIIAFIVSLLLIRGMIYTAADAVYNAINKQIKLTYDEMYSKMSVSLSEIQAQMQEHADATEPNRKDTLLYDVAAWAIECNGLSTAAICRHFSTSFRRAGKIVDQLHSMGICGNASSSGNPRRMLVDMNDLERLQQNGVFDN